MSTRKDTNIIQVILKPFLAIGFVVMLTFGLVYYLGYIIVIKLAKKENAYGGLKGFVQSLKAIVFSNAMKEHVDVYRNRSKVKKSRKQSAEYFTRPKGRMQISSRQEALDMQKEQKEPKKSYFFKRLFAYASIFFLREDIRKEKAIEIDQKYPPRKKKEKEYKADNSSYETYNKDSYAIKKQALEPVVIKEVVDETAVKRSLLHKRIMIASASIIVVCAMVFVGALAYAQELPANLNFISPKPTANLFETTVPVPENEMCEILPESEVEIYMEYSDEVTQAPQTTEIAESISDTADEDINVVETDGTEPSVISGNITTEAKVFRLGDEDPEVAKIQARLMELYYMASGDTTNTYGKATTYAMERFQRQHGLQVDGSTGAETLAILYADSAEAYKVEQGTEGSDVKEIQKRLYDLKYISKSSYVTGYFGSITSDAVKDFQHTNGLSADGIVGHNTYTKLFSSSAKKNSTSTSSNSNNNNSSSNDSSDDSSNDSGGGGTSSNDPTFGGTNTKSGTASDMIAVAVGLKNEGWEYVRGGKAPSYGGFDCSGFVYYVMNQAGIKTGYRDTSAWAKTDDYQRIDDMDDLQVGDVCVFEGHVGIYYGNEQMIHCTRWSNSSSSFSGILINSLDTDYRRNGWICGYRVAD